MKHELLELASRSGTGSRVHWRLPRLLPGAGYLVPACLSRTPGPLPASSGINSTPAASKACWISGLWLEALGLRVNYRLRARASAHGQSSCRISLSRTPGPAVPSPGMKTIPASSSANWICLRVVTFVPNPFSNLLTVFGDTPARSPKCLTPQPSAALAIRTCERVITKNRPSYLKTVASSLVSGILYQ
jgi:hypothetical protein